MKIQKILKISIFILFIFLLDNILGSILHKLYFTQKVGPNHTLAYAFRDCKADILILGASQAVHNYDTRIIEDSLKMSCYNAGQDGGHSILLQYAQVEVITKRYTPKAIFLEFTPCNIVHFPGDYDRLSILLPYYNDFPELRPLILLRSPYERVKLLSKIYPYNSNVFNIIRNNYNTTKLSRQDFNGFVPLKNKVKDINVLKIEPEKDNNLVVDTNMVFALEGIIKICKEKNISLFIISAPVFHTTAEKEPPVSNVSKLSLDIIKKENVKYFDLSYDDYFADRIGWYKDRSHLNEEGAVAFTNLLVSKIKSDK